jgi:hypothetical protein
MLQASLRRLSERIAQGKHPGAIRAELVEKGLDPEIATKLIDNLTALAGRRGWVPPKDFRAQMSAADFEAIPVDDEYPAHSYYERLIAGNDKFRSIGEEFPGGWGDVRLVKRLTRGQQLLVLLAVFDAQVKNGGVTQFFFNRPEYAFEVRDAIAYLGPPELLQNYERALAALLDNQDRWLELRRECYREQDNPSWEPFRQTYELLDLGWFDTAYFDERGYDARDGWVIRQRGFHHALMRRLAEYVKSHRAEFIEE